MGKTDKDVRKAKIKRGSASYERNNPRGKYERKGKHNTSPSPVEGSGAFPSGFFAMLAKKCFGW